MAMFPEDELSQARRFNRTLRLAPRFRAPGLLVQFMIQSSMRMGQAMVSGLAPGVRASTRRIDWKGCALNLRILRAEGPLRGVYIDYHGGGWSIGNAAMDDPVNSLIAKELQLAVVSVDYTLLPAASLATMIDECVAAADWVFAHGHTEFGAEEVVIGGESAGAHLAACALLRLKTERADFARLKGAVLIYGPFDLSGTASARSAAADALVLHGPSLQGGLSKLAPGPDEVRRDPAISPLYADLAGLPPAIFVVGMLDPLIDDSRMMAARWNEQSGNAELLVAPDAPHAFNRLPTRMAARTNAHLRDWVEARLGRGTAPRAEAE
jgi:acetyl esterase/lipase